MKTIAKILNDNHWYVIGAAVGLCVIGYAYGMQSKCPSLLDDKKQVTREELQNEYKYLTGLAEARAKTLDQKDAMKQALFDGINIIGSSGQVNPAGIMNLIATIGAVSFGLNRNQILKKERKKNSKNE